jgi:urease accessory protein
MYAESPLLLKTPHRKEPEPWPELATGAARVSLTAGAAGPVGGDGYQLDIEVGAHTTLVLGDVSPTLLLPGPGGAKSWYHISIDVGEHATLIWLAEPLIASQGCNHTHNITAALHPSARMMMREELLRGRHREIGGTVRQRVTVHRGGAPLYRQDLTVGPEAIGGNGAAVLGGAHAVGTVLTVDPVWEQTPPGQRLISPGAAVMPLAGPGVLISSVAEDNLALRKGLHAGLSHLGPPWQPS